MTTGQTQAPPLLPTIKLKRWHQVLLGALILLVLGLVAFVTFQPIQVLPRIRLAPGYALTDQDGQRLTNEDLRGHYVLYNFTHTDCLAPDCPQNDLILSELQQRLGEDVSGGAPVSFVTMSFDPEKDTPEQLRTYAQTLGADTEQWRFVSGDPARLKSIIGGGFEAYYQQNEDGTWDFSPTMVLVDGWGIVRAVYNSRTVTPDADTLIRHLSVLAEELENSQGVARLGYEAAHLFLCYAS
ncbi:MAG: SCO family protein [Chloroflexi bacterium]|nr:SCO family protein [Chloroflexota bacterium]